jgi:PPOX class probable F420-dependent enzyme
MESMTRAEVTAFLSSPPRCAKLATVRRDGRPHVVPVWFILDGDRVIFTAWHTSTKVQNILRDGRVAICVDADDHPYHYVLLEGCATLLDDSPEASRHWTTRIAGRYMGEHRAEAYGNHYGVEGKWVMQMTPDKVIAYKNIVD